MNATEPWGVTACTTRPSRNIFKILHLEDRAMTPPSFARFWIAAGCAPPSPWC